MKYSDFNMKEDGFAGHLAEPDIKTDKAVIVIMGGEKSLLPGIKIAESFADYGIMGLAVSLFGAEGLPDAPDRVPVEMFIRAAAYLREEKEIRHLSIYGQSMGSIFASLAAQELGDVENLILVSPTHVPFEGTLKDKKTMTGHSVATLNGKELPFVREDFSKIRAGKYQKYKNVPYRVTGMWKAYYEAYLDHEREEKAMLAVERSNARILLIAGCMDEMWPSMYSVEKILKRLEDADYRPEVRTILFEYGSHLAGMMPDMERERRLYRMAPLIGIMYRTFGKYRWENMEYLLQAEQEIISWIMGNSFFKGDQEDE